MSTGVVIHSPLARPIPQARTARQEGARGRNAEPSERIPPPARSAEPSRKIAFHFLILRAPIFLLEGKAIFLRGRPPLCGGWRRVSGGFVFWICVSGLVKSDQKFERKLN